MDSASAAVLSGAVTGGILGLVGGGGSILAVPLLAYAVGVTSPHVAIGTGAVAVALSAFANLLNKLRQGHVKWRCALVFSAAGIAGSYAGSSLGKAVDGEALLALFGVVMMAVAVVTALYRDHEGDIGVRLTRGTARELLPALLIGGAAVGLLSGFFGIGGGFLIVPALMMATGMPITSAAATSLVAVTAFGATTAFNYALAGLVDWRIAGLFVTGGLAGGFAGTAAAGRLGARKGTLNLVFAAIVMAAGVFVVWKGWPALAGLVTART